MPKKNLPSYRLHKPSGQAIVSLRGKIFYLGQYKSKESRAKYSELIADYLANGEKLPPTRSTTDLTLEAAVVRFLDYAEGYYVKNGQPTATFTNYRESLAHVVRWYGAEPVSEFGPLALQFIRDKMIESGYVRKTINDRVSCIVCFFQWLSINELCHVDVYNALKAVPRLKAGKTKAPDNDKVPPVPDDIVNKTLPFLPPIVADMVQVQRLCGMRPQDVCNMRSIDIDRTGDVWVYRPYTHKTEHHGKKLAKAIGPKAQAILAPYLVEKAENPEAFLFSPADTVRLQRAARRAKRKSSVQPSQVNRKKSNPKRVPKDCYSSGSYRKAIQRVCAKAGVPKWSPNQLRHSAGTTTAANFSVEAAKEFLGHASIKTTEQYYVAPLPELAAKVAREIG